MLGLGTLLMPGDACALKYWLPIFADLGFTSWKQNRGFTTRTPVPQRTWSTARYCANYKNSLLKAIAVSYLCEQKMFGVLIHSLNPHNFHPLKFIQCLCVCVCNKINLCHMS